MVHHATLGTFSCISPIVNLSESWATGFCRWHLILVHNLSYTSTLRRGHTPPSLNTHSRVLMHPTEMNSKTNLTLADPMAQFTGNAHPHIPEAPFLCGWSHGLI